MKLLEAAMSGNYLDSKFLLKKYRFSGSDRISQLPDDVITHILSFLPLKEAVATSILSPRWLNLWKYTPHLIFVNNRWKDPMINIPIAIPIPEQINSDVVRSLKNVEWVNSVLNSFKALSLKQLIISLYLDREALYQVSKWLHFAFSRRVEKLKLDFVCADFVLDVNIFSGIQSSDYRFLRELTLRNLSVTGEAVAFVYRNCPVLEGLIIQATLKSDLVVGGALKYVELNPRNSPDILVKVSAPDLTRLTIKMDLRTLLLEHVPNLVEASFALWDDGDTMLPFAKVAAKLEILALQLILPQAFPVPRMPKLKKLVLDYHIVNRAYLLPITCLLQASPSLEEFKLEITSLRQYFYNGSPICKPIFEVPKHGGFPHSHLDVFEFSGFCERAPDHVELVMYIANNCVALQRIIITPISISVARSFRKRLEADVDADPLIHEDDVIAEKQEALDQKKSAEELLADKLPHHIQLLIN